MGEIKQTNFRIDQDTANKFRAFCEENGMNQAQGFDHLIQVVEMDRAKSVTPDRLTEIEDFEQAIKKIMAAYLKSVQLCNDAESRAKEQFVSSLSSKDRTIADLQKNYDLAMKTSDAANSSLEDALRSLNEAREKVVLAEADRDSLKRDLAEKNRINEILSAKLDAQEADISESQNTKKEMEKYKEKVSTLELEIRELRVELNAAKVKLTNQEKQAAMAQQLAVQKVQSETEHHYVEQLRAADKENARLQAKVEQLLEQAESAKNAGAVGKKGN